MTIKVKVDVCNKEKISGWAIDSSDFSQGVALDLLIDGKFHGMIFAYKDRDDLLKAGIGNGKHGFIYKFSKLIRNKVQAEVSLLVSETREIVYTDRIVFVR